MECFGQKNDLFDVLLACVFSKSSDVDGELIHVLEEVKFLFSRQPVFSFILNFCALENLGILYRGVSRLVLLKLDVLH